MPKGEVLLEMQGVARTYRQGSRALEVLRSIDLTLNAGEMVALIGPSGTGKSTLLHLAGLLERPDGGRIAMGGQDCGQLGDRARTRLRRERLGFVYQFHHLLPEFTALENVVLPQMIGKKSRRNATSRAAELLSRVGLEDRQNHQPAKLSGGEQQRVAIARAVANNPEILLADEPTGNLDPDTANQVISHLIDIVQSEGRCGLIATHNPEIAQRMDRTVTLVDGRLSTL